MLKNEKDVESDLNQLLTSFNQYIINSLTLIV